MLRADVLAWCRDLLAERVPGRAFVLGINGPQGAGKSTLVRWLERRFAEEGVRAVGVSIDDFYLTRAEQAAVSETYAGNRYLAQRGYPGTHDVALGTQVLEALTTETGPIALPVYDKAAHGGLGDRAPESRVVVGPVDLILFEGWMLGFTPDPLAAAEAEFAVVDALLARYAPWRDRLDAMLQLVMAEPDQVIAWRMEAEATMRASGLGGMLDAAIRDYVGRFLPAYAVWPVRLAARPPVPGRHRVVVLGRDREAIAGWRREHAGWR